MALSEKKQIELSGKDTIDSAIAQINLAPAPLFVFLADYDASLDPAIRSLCSRAIIPAALDSETIIIDNGSSKGFAALAGQAAREDERSPILIGIVPPAIGSPDSNHSVLVRLPADSHDSMKAVFQIAAGLSRTEHGSENKLVLTILIGGGSLEKEGLLYSARRGWPILLVEGSGGIADQILNAIKVAPDRTSVPPVADPEIREIIETADIDSYSIAANPDDLHRILMARVDRRVNTLEDSWSRFDDLDTEAIRRQVLSRKLQFTILSLGVAATLLAILQSGEPTSLLEKVLAPVFRDSFSTYGTLALKLSHVLMVLTPITISILVAVSSTFREGNKWILLRASAEAVKREIFRYRMKAGPYNEDECENTSREAKMAEKLKEITTALAQTEVNRTCLPAVARNDSDRLTFLEPDDYLRLRIEDQISYFRTRIEEFSKRLKRVQICIYIAGGSGTLLAAFKGDVWVALTTAIAAAFASRLEMDQVENTLVQYNQAFTTLRNIKSWWKSLSYWERKRRRNIELLVEQTEKTLEGELAGWVQQMETTLDKLTERQETANNSGSASAARAGKG